jgi:hypothetical protein
LPAVRNPCPSVSIRVHQWLNLCPLYPLYPLRPSRPLRESAPVLLPDHRGS